MSHELAPTDELIPSVGNNQTNPIQVLVELLASQQRIIESLQRANESLVKTNASQQATIAAMQSQIESLQKTNAGQRDTNAHIIDDSFLHDDSINSDSDQSNANFVDFLKGGNESFFVHSEGIKNPRSSSSQENIINQRNKIPEDTTTTTTISPENIKNSASESAPTSLTPNKY